MGSKILSELGIDSGLLLLILLFLVVIYTVLMIYWLVRSRKMFQRYEVFMRGKDAASLEDLLAQLTFKIENLQNQDMANKDMLRVINRNLVNSYQKTGITKYNAFDGMGGMASFALALLDLNNNGFILNVIHSRSSCYTYLKEIKNGICEEAPLAEEERISLEMALNYGKAIPEDTEETAEE